MNHQPNARKIDLFSWLNPYRPARSGRLALAALIASTSLAALPSAHASLMAYEGFNYPNGSGNLTGQNSGFGWKGAWQGVVNGSSSVLSSSLVAGVNAPSGYDALSTGRAAFTPNGTRTGRNLDISPGGSFGVKGYLDGNGNIGAAGKTIYISFMQQPNVANNNYYEFEFHRGSLNDPGRVGGVGCDTGGSTNVFLRTPSAAQTVIGPASTSVSFYVVRIDFLGGDSNVKVYQNPTSATEPGVPTLAVNNAGDLSFSGLSFGAFVGSTTVAHDEVRVGETWADVTAPGAYSTGLWDGGGANNNWSTAGNWDNDQVPVFAASLTFAGSTRLNNTNDLTGISANAITFDSAAGAFSLNGNSLGLNGNISFNAEPPSLITQTINLPLIPSGNVTIDVRTNGNITVNGSITGTNTEVTQTSPGNSGILTLAGNNSLKGLVINNGTNRITGTTTVNGIGGSSFFYLADGQTTRRSTLVIESGATLTVSGPFQDAAVIGRDGGIGTITQNGGTFNFNINDGSHEFLFVGASGNSNTRATYNMNGGLLDMNGKTLGVALGANTVITGVVNQVSGVISNVGNLLFSPFFAQGHGIYNLSGGSLYIGSGGITAFGGAVYELNLGGGTIGAVASWSSALNMNLTGSNGPVKFNPAGNSILLSGVLSGTGGLTVNGSGVLELSGANTYTGDTTVTAGSTLQLDSTGSGSGALRLTNGSALVLNFSGTYAIGGLFTNGVAVPVGTYNSGNLPAFISGGGDLNVTAGISQGIWTGSGGNNNWSTAANWDNNAVPIFPHSLSFTNGARLTNTNDLNNITISSLTFGPAAGAFVINGNDITLSGNIGFSANPPAPLTETVNLNMIWNADKTIDTPTNGNLSLGGSITTFANNLNKTGAGTLTLGGVDGFAGFIVGGGTNILTGNITLAGTGGSRFYVGDIGTVGTLVIQPGAALNITGLFGDAGVIGRDSGVGTIIQNGGTFSYNPGNQGNFFVGASGNATTRAEYRMNGGTFDLNNYTLNVALSANNSTLITGVVSQVSGSIVNVGKFDLGAFNFGPGRGIYRLTGGSIYIGANGIVSDSGVYEIYLGGGTVGAYASWVSSLNMSLTGSNGPVVFDTAGNVITLSGVLSGTGGLTVTGGGTLELSGGNSYSGDTTVSSGTLQLDLAGSSSGTFRVANGALLNLNFGGTFAVSGLVTNGVPVPNGTYNAGNLPGFIFGTGNLLVAGVSSGTWTGLGANRNWSTAANWDHNAVPIFPIGLTFAGSTGLNNTNDLSSITANSITFSSTAGAFTLNGNSLGLQGNIGFSGNPASPITQTINLPLTPTADVNVSTPANGNVVINGNIVAANNTFYKVDNGTLTLNGVNTFAGFDVDGGTNLLTGSVLVSGTGGSRTYVANGDYIGNATGTLVIQNGSTFTISGNFGDAWVVGRDGGVGRVIQNGGVFNYNPANQNYLFLAAGNNPATRGEYDMNGGLLDLNGKTLGLGLGVNVLVTGIVNQVSGVITNVGQIFLDSFFSSGHSIFSISGGSIYIGSGGITVQSGGGYEIYLGGGTVAASASWSSSLGMSLTGINGPVTFNPAGNTITLSGPLSGPGGLTVSGGGILELAGANSYAGDSTVNAGSTLRLDNTGSTAAAFRAFTGATFNLNYIGNYTVGSLYTNGVALPGGTYNSGNLGSYITGTGSLLVSGSIPSTPTNITYSVSGGQLTIAWPGSYLGWILQQQTNALGVGITTNWADIPGTASVTSTNIPIVPTRGSAFYRLRHP